MALAQRQKALLASLLFIFGSILIFVIDGFEAENREEDALDIQVKSLRVDRTDVASEIVVQGPVETKEDITRYETKEPVDKCVEICKVQTEKASRWDPEALLSTVTSAKQIMIERIKVGYGEYFEKIFLETRNPITSIIEEDTYDEAFRRKLQIKILKAQVGRRESELSKMSTPECDCSGRRNLQGFGNPLLASTNDGYPLKLPDGWFTKYVWTTGGHSASAGHGNLYNESYTAYLERDLKPLFASVGIDFEGRNYAMGGTASGPEVAMCFEQIFGTDVDFFTWDYGMTDYGLGGDDMWARLAHFIYRGIHSSNFPAAIVLHNGESKKQILRRVVANVESLGVPIFEMLEDTFQERKAATPDTMQLTQAEIDALPEYVRLLRCGEEWEKGDICGMEKYSKWGCEKRARQVGWHPGFKAQAMDGHVMAFFLANRLVDAVSDLAQRTDILPETLLKQLQNEEEDSRRTFLSSDTPFRSTPESLSFFDRRPEFSLEESVIWNGPSMCRTARLPAESRYLGYTTNTDKIGGIAMLGQEKHDIGIPLQLAIQPDSSMGEMKLVYEPGGEERAVCDAILKPDYKDYFYTHQVHGWNTMTIPNDKEKLAYSYNPDNVRGYIFMHLVVCDWGNCPRGDMRESGLSEAKWELTVNGRKVIDIGPMGLLISEEGIVWTPNDGGVYEIRARVNEENGFVRVSAFVIY